jgi:hypothetical protein
VVMKGGKSKGIVVQQNGRAIDLLSVVHFFSLLSGILYSTHSFVHV